MPVIITTPRPPLNLFEVVRVPITDAWTTVYEVPLYRIPANGPTPQRDVDAAAIMTGVMIANSMSIPITVSAQILNIEGDPFKLLDGILISVGDYILLDIERQVLKTDEILQLKCGTAQTADAHFSFVLNQREEFQVIV